MSLHIRQAAEEDLPAVLGLYAQPGMNDGEAVSLEQARDILRTMRSYPFYHLYVASDDGDPDRVLASYALLVMHNIAHRGSPAAVVENVVVDEALRSHGIGRQLMEHARERAREAGCYKLALSSNARRTRSHAFYESLDFQRHGISFVIEP
jgi:GNAT superfamily N-acetyltransferase